MTLSFLFTVVYSILDLEVNTLESERLFLTLSHKNPYSNSNRKFSYVLPLFRSNRILNYFGFYRYIGESIRQLLSKWDGLAEKAAKSNAGGDLKGYAVIDLLVWLNALAFE